MARKCTFIWTTLTALLAAGAAQAQSPYVQAVLNAGPQAYFRLTSVGAASQVNGYTTTFNGAATVTAPGGGAPLKSDPQNVGAQLNGTTGTYITTSLISPSATDSSATHAGSLIAWIDLAQLPSVSNRFYYIAGRSQSGNDFDVQIQNDNRLYFYTNSGANTSYALPTTSLLNTYHFVAATDDPTSGVRSLYFDGALVAQDTNVGDRGVSTSAFSIGASTVFGGREFNGNIDEVALYNRSLSSSEVQTIYNASFSPAAAPEPAPLAALAVGSLGLGMLVLVKRRRVGSGMSS